MRHVGMFMQPRRLGLESNCFTSCSAKAAGPLRFRRWENDAASLFGRPKAPDSQHPTAA
jgi:hypothetical protein